MESSSGTSSTLLNKIIIPVITTVLGASAIYFLGFNKRFGGGRTDMEQMLLSKEATVQAWKSFVTAQNIGYSNSKSLGEEYVKKFDEASKQSLENLAVVWKDYESEFLRENKKFTHDIEQILKEKDIDRDFVSMLNRTLDNGKDQEEKFRNFIDQMVTVVRSDRGLEDKRTNLTNELSRFQEKGKKDAERMVTESEGIAKILIERYNQAFNLNELDVYADYKKEKDKKKPDETVVNKMPDNNGPAPVDPNKGVEYKETVQNNNNPTYDNTRTNNQAEPTESLLTGNWVMTGGELELNQGGEMNWAIGNGFVSGDWKLTSGKLRMNATALSTGQRLLLIGQFSDFTRNSFTLTLISATPRETYYFTRKR